MPNIFRNQMLGYADSRGNFFTTSTHSKRDLTQYSFLVHVLPFMANMVNLWIVCCFQMSICIRFANYSYFFASPIDGRICGDLSLEICHTFLLSFPDNTPIICWTYSEVMWIIRLWYGSNAEVIAVSMLYYCCIFS